MPLSPQNSKLNAALEGKSEICMKLSFIIHIQISWELKYEAVQVWTVKDVGYRSGVARRVGE